MAHEVVEMFSVRETPWHGLGHVLDDHPEDLKHAYKLAGMDYPVNTYPLFTEDGREAPAVAIIRDDTGEILGTSGKSYEVLNNWDAISWFQPFLDSKLAKLETAGVLRQGKKIWILAQINRDPISIVPKANDNVKAYILLSNGHDGVTAGRLGFTPIRVVCHNTLSWAHGAKASKLVRVFHRGNVKAALDKLRDAMDLANEEFVASTELYQELAKHEISSKDLKRYVRQVFKPAEDPDDKNVAKQLIKRIRPLFEQGRGNDVVGVRGTAWAAYNAVTEYLSYGRGVNNEIRLDNLWFGDAVTLNARALQVAKKELIAA